MSPIVGPRIAGGHEQHAVEFRCEERRLAGVKMGDVDRVESPAQDPGAHVGEHTVPEASPVGALA